MGLISGMVMGMMVGIALMAAWNYMMKYRSTKRIAKAVDVKLLGSLTRDDLKKICGDSYPQWISFPVFEQVKWLNKILGKMWPFIAELEASAQAASILGGQMLAGFIKMAIKNLGSIAASMVIKESVEPLLEDYRPPGISSLKFSKLFLGNVPPKVEGIRVQSLKNGQITMDIDLRWGGDPSIILAVEALVASLPIQLKDLQVFTVIRVIFQLSEDIPCISAVVVALLSDPKPKIEYTLKAVGGSLTAIPGLSDMIDDTVKTIVSDMLEWPHRVVVPLGPVDTSDLELKPQGSLKVTVVKATSLKNMELIGKSDPYVVLQIRPMFRVKTKVVDNNLNPEWNEEFDLIVEDKETQFVTFEVLDQDVGQDKRLGITKLPLIDLESEAPKEIDLALLPSLDSLKVKDKKDRGSLKVRVKYHEFNKEEQLKAFEEEKEILRKRRELKEAGLIGSTMDALDGAAGVVGSGLGLVKTGVGAGFGLVGSGVGAGASLAGSGLGAVGSGLGKAGRFMGIGSSKKSGSVPPSPAGNGKSNGSVPPSPAGDGKKSSSIPPSPSGNGKKSS